MASMFERMFKRRGKETSVTPQAHFSVNSRDIGPRRPPIQPVIAPKIPKSFTQYTEQVGLGVVLKTADTFMTHQKPWKQTVLLGGLTYSEASAFALELVSRMGVGRAVSNSYIEAFSALLKSMESYTPGRTLIQVNDHRMELQRRAVSASNLLSIRATIEQAVKMSQMVEFIYKVDNVSHIRRGFIDGLRSEHIKVTHSYGYRQYQLSRVTSVVIEPERIPDSTDDYEVEILYDGRGMRTISLHTHRGYGKDREPIYSD